MKRRFDTASLEATDRYKLLTGLVVPRPIGWIGTRSSDGVNNLAPYSFFNAVVSTPPTVMFAPGMRFRTKDTLANVRDTGWFTVSVVSEELADAMNVTSGDHPPDVDEFALAGLTAVDGVAVDAPLVAEAPAHLECRVNHIHVVGEEPSASVVFGEVLVIHVDEELLDGTRIDFAALRPVGRFAGSWYRRGGELFEMERPQLD